MRIPHSTSDIMKSVDDCSHVTNQIGINEIMVRTASALCTNSRFFALKVFCTEINVWQHGLWCHHHISQKLYFFALSKPMQTLSPPNKMASYTSTG